MFSFAENYDIELCNKDLNTRGEKTEFCPSYRVVEKRASLQAFEES